MTKRLTKRTSRSAVRTVDRMEHGADVGADPNRMWEGDFFESIVDPGGDASELHNLPAEVGLHAWVKSG